MLQHIFVVSVKWYRGHRYETDRSENKNHRFVTMLSLNGYVVLASPVLSHVSVRLGDVTGVSPNLRGNVWPKFKAVL